MSSTAIWLTILAMGAVTYALRLSMIVLLTRVEIPALLRRSLRYVPPAVLSAIIFPELLAPSGELNLSLRNLRLLAGLVAGAVAWRTGSMVLTIAIGMALLWAAQAMIR